MKVQATRGTKSSTLLDVRALPWIAAAGALLGVAAAVTVAGQTAHDLRASRSRRIALIGDSYAVGLGPELAKLLPDFQYGGRVGSNTSQWASWLPGWLAGYEPSLTLVALGVNDGSAPNSANYHAVVGALGGIGSRVVWVEPPARVSTPAVRRAIASLGVPTVPATDTALAADGLHPTSYGSWAKEIAGRIA